LLAIKAEAIGACWSGTATTDTSATVFQVAQSTTCSGSFGRWEAIWASLSSVGARWGESILRGVNASTIEVDFLPTGVATMGIGMDWRFQSTKARDGGRLLFSRDTAQNSPKKSINPDSLKTMAGGVWTLKMMLEMTLRNDSK
jgi:hypothetical protein